MADAISASNRIIRDPIHGLVSTDSQLRAVLDTCAIQRLRWIRQTGLAYLVFPTAEHSRFSHALGAYAIAHRMFAHLRNLSRDIEVEFFPLRLDDDAGREFAIAALCHDIGHTAFSHVFETSLLPGGMKDHEQCTLLLLEMNDLQKAIGNYCDFDAVLQLFDGSHRIPALSTLLSGVYDVDRCDYLLRDSFLMGVDYGKYDLPWLIHAMSLRKGEHNLPLLLLDGPRGLDAFRQYVLARLSMYRQIYYHPTVRAAQKLLRSVFERAQDVSTMLEPSLVPASLQRVILGHERPDTDDFLSTNDFSLMSAVHNFAAAASDPFLKYLAQSFKSRKLPKKVYDSTQLHSKRDIFQDIDKSSSIIGRLRALVTRCVRDIAEVEEAASYLVILDKIKFPKVPLSDVYFYMRERSHSLDELKGWGGDYNLAESANSFEITRLYVPDEARDEATALIEEELTR